jgi:hypothetical protein
MSTKQAHFEKRGGHLLEHLVERTMIQSSNKMVLMNNMIDICAFYYTILLIFLQCEGKFQVRLGLYDIIVANILHHFMAALLL